LSADQRGDDCYWMIKLACEYRLATRC